MSNAQNAAGDDSGNVSIVTASIEGSFSHYDYSAAVIRLFISTHWIEFSEFATENGLDANELWSKLGGELEDDGEPSGNTSI